MAIKKGGVSLLFYFTVFDVLGSFVFIEEFSYSFFLVFSTSFFICSLLESGVVP